MSRHGSRSSWKGRSGKSALRRAQFALTAACVSWLSVSCAASAPNARERPADSRYPEKKRPEPARSASDGEVLGAHGQSPEDTLQGSPTNEHPAPGWKLEDGKLVPDPEWRRGEGADAPTGAPNPEQSEDCEPIRQGAAGAPSPGSSGKRPCPPAPEAPR